MQAFYFDSVSSTNDLARSMIADGTIQHCAYLVAREQTSGRGNRGRTWLSPRDAGIYLTVVDRPVVQDCGDLHAFTRAAAIACVEVLESSVNIPVRIKPINDLYVDGRKLGGILTEAVIEQNSLRALITGVGINIRKVDHRLPPEHISPVCLQELVSPMDFAEINVQALTLALVERIQHWNRVIACGNRAALETQWRLFAIEAAPQSCALLDTPA